MRIGGRLGRNDLSEAALLDQYLISGSISRPRPVIEAALLSATVVA